MKSLVFWVNKLLSDLDHSGRSMSKTATATNTSTVMMCIGAPLPKKIIDQLEKLDRPNLGDVRWTDSKQWFISFQNFFKMRPDLDIEKFKQLIKNEIFYKYFPLIIEPKDMILSPSVQLPKTLEWKFNIVCAKDQRLDVNKMLASMKVDMREAVKNACYSYQSIECDPSLVLARIPDSEKNNRSLINLRDIKPFRDRFYLNEMSIIKVTKNEKGLNYEYLEIKE